MNAEPLSAPESAQHADAETEGPETWYVSLEGGDVLAQPAQPPAATETANVDGADRAEQLVEGAPSITSSVKLKILGFNSESAICVNVIKTDSYIFQGNRPQQHNRFSS